jgi:cytidine deaminase
MLAREEAEAGEEAEILSACTNRAGQRAIDRVATMARSAVPGGADTRPCTGCRLPARDHLELRRKIFASRDDSRDY